MINHFESQIQFVSNFNDLVRFPFQGKINAACWKRNLKGDFSEIVSKIELKGNMAELFPVDLLKLQLSESGNLAREILLNDLKLLTDHGASPTLNLIKSYERDDIFPFFPTDVYSYHVDQSPIPTSTFLCTYFGDASEILPNDQATQKVLIPEIRDELKNYFSGNENDFECFLSENFFNLHYQANATAEPIKLGIGQLWRLAVDHPENLVPPCVHRAPEEKSGQTRLLMIC